MLINMDISNNQNPIGMNISGKKTSACVDIPNCAPSSGETGDYNELENRPALNGKTIQGAKTSKDYDIYGINNPETFVFTQATPSNIWTIKHNLNKYPSITVVDSAGSVVVGDCDFISLDTVICTFNGAFSGTCYLN